MSSHLTLSQKLSDGISQLGLTLEDAQCQRLLDYLGMLSKWNSVYNLTSIRDPLQMVTQHLLDSLTVLPAFNSAKNILDVGSGGGLPGIVLSIARPDARVSLIDTVQKKTAFLTQVKSELGLSNVTVHNGKVEQLQVNDKFDTITSRAFADLNDFVTWSEHLLGEGGRFIAMKGQIPGAEIDGLSDPWKVAEIRSLSVPGMSAQRHLIFIAKHPSSQGLP